MPGKKPSVNKLLFWPGERVSGHMILKTRQEVNRSGVVVTEYLLESPLIQMKRWVPEAHILAQIAGEGE